MHEENFEEEPLDPASDRLLRVLVAIILIIGGGYAALEFTHWLVHGGFRPFLLGAACTLTFFIVLVIWAQLLARGVRFLHSRPSLFLIAGLATALGILLHHFLLA